ncbi:hypothetical protein [Falsiroseomonas sp.]|uniref:hypothetical protein n=1 Tax=Falsiroseomonas sp. TaxID=2870721 RepID=UPI002736EF65|nr:hypothetical protein [Falsiroseomonas sp.]MDP3415813.1 hypothetical protein [Falsiroseomonas sp.]
MIRLVLVQCAVGFGIATLAMAGLLLADPGDARSLLLGAAGHWWPAALLWVFLGMTFGAVQIGVATMLLATPDPPPRPRGRPVPVRLAVPAVIRRR